MIAGLDHRVSAVDRDRDRPARGFVEVAEATPGRPGRVVVRVGRDGRGTATLLEAWLRGRAHETISERAAALAPAIGVTPARIDRA